MSIEQFHARPKTVFEKYKGVTIEARYDPDKELWHWRFEVPSHVIVIEDDSETLNEAIRAAKRKVDKVNGV